jgi:drug/metabolite transporter (DMT)-like permease
VQTSLFDGAYDGSFMIVALLIALAVLLTLSLLAERREIIPSLRVGAPMMLVCGLSNALVNLFVMLCAKIMDKSLMFPLISAGGIILTWIVALFIYKEKMNAKQNAGMLLGIASIVLFNI